jgi:hypothetical protein
VSIKEGVIEIIPLPQRGRQAQPIPEDIVKNVLKTLPDVQKGQGVSVGRLFEKQHQAQSFGKRLLEALGEADAQYQDKLGTSVIPTSDEREDGKPKGPFVLAIRKAA